MTSTDETAPSIDPKQLRSALGSFATGVTIITAHVDGQDIGLTANSFNSVSLNPPMVLWSLGRSSFSLPFFERATHFAVHILAEDQEPLSTRFATRGNEKFSQLPITRGADTMPLLDGCTARFQCKKVFEYEGGDHVIFVGEVVAFDHEPKRPLLFHGGRYALTAPSETAEPVESLGAAEDSLSYLLTRANVALRGASLNYAETHGLNLPERYLLGVLLDSGGRTMEEANDVIGYTGLKVTEPVVDTVRKAGLVTVSDGPVARISLTKEGRDKVVAMIALTRAQSAEAEIQLGPKAAILKDLLKQLATDANNDARIERHMEVMKNIEVAAR